MCSMLHSAHDLYSMWGVRTDRENYRCEIGELQNYIQHCATWARGERHQIAHEHVQYFMVSDYWRADAVKWIHTEMRSSRRAYYFVYHLHIVNVLWYLFMFMSSQILAIIRSRMHLSILPTYCECRYLELLHTLHTFTIRKNLCLVFDSKLLSSVK